MKRWMLIVLLLPAMAVAQTPQQTPQTLVLSVADILPNYGLDTAWVNDTVGLMDYLSAQEQDYVALTNLCVSIRTKAQRAINSIENDYPQRDSLIWIDSTTVLGDYAIYEYRLRRLADLAGRLSVRYSRMEQRRIEAEKEAARQRAIEEARRRQDERNQAAADLRASIEVHHRAVISGCDGIGISDKSKLKNLKDLYYSYLMVYNKYDLSQSNATDEGIAKLEELNAFQSDLLENVLGSNSLPHQIENFKNILKVRCEKEYTDVYRSYLKVFKHTYVPVAFASVKEYEDYINQLHTIASVQQRYLQTLDLRAAIASGSDAIAHHYGKKHKQVVNSYNDVLRGLNQVPAFTTNAESLLFIRGLEDFIAAQQRYIDDYALLEEIDRRTDTIVSRSSSINEVAAAYRDIADGLVPLPSYSNTEGADHYDDQLEAVRQVQQCYLDVIALRKQIAANDDSLAATRKIDKTLANGYRLLRKQAVLRPNFATIEGGRSFIASLQSFIDMQQLCLATMDKLKEIDRRAKLIAQHEGRWRNIIKSYDRMEKAYQGINEITNRDDLERYSRQCDQMIVMQQAYLTLLTSDMAGDANIKLRRESDIEKIKLIVGIK